MSLWLLFHRNYAEVREAEEKPSRLLTSVELTGSRMEFRYTMDGGYSRSMMPVTVTLNVASWNGGEFKGALSRKDIARLEIPTDTTIGHEKKLSKVDTPRVLERLQQVGL